MARGLNADKKEMEIIAKLNHLRIAPRKVRKVAALLNGKEVLSAERELEVLPGRVAKPLAKLLASAVANATHSFRIERENLKIKRVVVNGGSPLKRSRPRAFGRAFPIWKRTSHVTLSLVPIEGISEEKRRRKKISRPLARSGMSHETHERKEAGQRKFEIAREAGRNTVPQRAMRAVRKVFQRKAI